MVVVAYVPHTHPKNAYFMGLIFESILQDWLRFCELLTCEWLHHQKLKYILPAPKPKDLTENRCESRKRTPQNLKNNQKKVHKSDERSMNGIFPLDFTKRKRNTPYVISDQLSIAVDIFLLKTKQKLKRINAAHQSSVSVQKTTNN